MRQRRIGFLDFVQLGRSLPVSSGSVTWSLDIQSRQNHSPIQDRCADRTRRRMTVDRELCVLAHVLLSLNLQERVRSLRTQKDSGELFEGKSLRALGTETSDRDCTRQLVRRGR